MSRHDTVVVGAGVTGLVAAWRLAEAGQDVVVLEARDRVGGRLRSERHDGSLFEIGGQWVSPDQDALIELLDELGLETYERHREGASLYVGRDGAARRFTGERLPLEPDTVIAIEQLTKTLDALTAEIDPDRPWDHPEAERLDRVTFQQWLVDQCDDVEARDNIALYVGPAMLTKPAWSFSALQALLMAASAGSFKHLVDADFILDRRVVGGLASVPLELGRRLGDRVRLDQDVTAIEYDDAGATVVVGEERIRARRVIIAVPPPLVRRIRFTPELPAEHRHAREHQSFGLVIKVQAEYSTPFWRERGLCGTGFGPYELVHEVYDNTPDGSPTGHLVGFVSDEAADRVGALGDDERRNQVLASLAAYFGDAARTPVTYVESDWQHQELTGGAYGTSFDVGGLTRYGRVLRQPLGPIEFGTSDVAGLGFQHVDGAVRVGTEIAHRILAPGEGIMIRNVIDGELCTAQDGRVSDVVDPSTGKSYDVAALSGAGDVDAAYAAATRAFRTWRRTTPAERQRALLALADALEARTDDLVAAEVENTGKPVALTRSEEIAAGIDHLRFFAGAARSLEGASAGEYLAGHTSYVRREPVGVIGQVAPWNYPFMMAIWKIAPALAAGNTVVLKPSDTTPVTASLLGEIALGVLPPGVLNVVCGDRGTGRLVVSHADAAMVSITGSTAAGKQVAAAAAEHVTRVHLELGGKAPAIVFADADLPAAVEGIVTGGFFNAGQDCTAVTRVLVQEEVAERFQELLVEAVSQLRTGPPSDEGALYGPLNNASQLARVSAVVESLPEHATVLTGGHRVGSEGYFFAPTVVGGVRQDDAIVQQETFGPVLTLQTFGSEAEAIELANDVDLGLASSVWTSDHGTAHRCSVDLDFGCVWVNTHIPLVAEMPHGGFKQSGYGKDLSQYGLDDHTRIKHVMHAHG